MFVISTYPQLFNNEFSLSTPRSMHSLCNGKTSKCECINTIENFLDDELRSLKESHLSINRNLM